MDWYGLPSGENGPIFSGMLYSFEWMKTDVFKPILSQCWIQVNAHVPSKIVPFFFFAENEQNGFKNSTCKRLFFGNGEKKLKMQALEVAHCVSKQFVVEIEKQFHSYRLLLHRFSEKCFGIPRKHNIINTYLKQIPDISAKNICKIFTRLDFRRKVRST